MKCARKVTPNLECFENEEGEGDKAMRNIREGCECLVSLMASVNGFSE